MKHRLWPEAEAREREEAQRRSAAAQTAFEEQRRASRQQRGVRLVAIDDCQIEIRAGANVIGGLDYDGRTSRLRVILGNAYVGTEMPHVWTGGPAAIEIDLHTGIEQLLGSRGALGD